MQSHQDWLGVRRDCLEDSIRTPLSTMGHPTPSHTLLHHPRELSGFNARQQLLQKPHEGRGGTVVLHNASLC